MKDLFKAVKGFFLDPEIKTPVKVATVWVASASLLAIGVLMYILLSISVWLSLGVVFTVGTLFSIAYLVNEAG
jgi:hypothetical protein